MRRNWIRRAVKMALIGMLAVTLFTFVVMNLWNWLVPAIFGWQSVNFWQALGLLLLSRILFGGFRGGPGRHMHLRRRMMDRWEQMTPEGREKFRQGMRGRCGQWGMPAATPGPQGPKIPTFRDESFRLP